MTDNRSSIYRMGRYVFISADPPLYRLIIHFGMLDD